MNDRTKLAKMYLQGIATKSEFMSLLNILKISSEERYLLEEVYLNNKPLGYVADKLGYSLQTIKRMHKFSLEKVSDFVYDSTRK